jgi:hypothetical protein
MESNVKIRIDDFPIWGKYCERVTYDQTTKILSYFEDRNIEYYLGVVGDYTTDEDIDFIINKLPNAVPLLHGFTHNVDRWDLPKKTIGWRNEFDGRTPEYLKTKMRDFCYRFSCFDIGGIIFPFNSFNQCILDILDEFNFSFVCTGPETKTFTYHTNLNYHTLKKYHSEGIYYSFHESIKDTIHRINTMPENYLMCYHLTEIKC